MIVFTWQSFGWKSHSEFENDKTHLYLIKKLVIHQQFVHFF
jgi:hypothetical protein